MDFFRAIEESTKLLEAPNSFYKWASYTVVSAILKDHVYFDMQAYKTYPNIYVLLYGPSGIRKGPPISLAEQIVSKIGNTRVINGRASIEAVIKELGTYQTKPGAELVKDSCGFIVASELSSSIISNTAAMDILTNLYDRSYNTEKWHYRLKVGESHTLIKPTVTWLSGTNEALFKEFLPDKNIYGGLLGRTFIIKESKRSKINSLMFPTASPNVDKLAAMLNSVVGLKGEFQAGDGVRETLDTWYNEFVRTTEVKFQDDTGFISRILDYIIKLSMIIAVGRRQELIIQVSDVQESIENLLPIVAPAKNIVRNLKKQDDSSVSKRGMLLSFITKKEDYTATRDEILRSLGLYIDSEDLDKIIQTFQQANIISMKMRADTVTYTLNMHNEKIRNWVEEYKK